MKILITYDISDNKVRRKIEAILSSYGERVNLSVFEIETKKSEFKKLIFQLEENSTKEESIRIYVLNELVIQNSFIIHSTRAIFEQQELYF